MSTPTSFSPTPASAPMQEHDIQLQKLVEQSSLASGSLDLKVSGLTSSSASNPAPAPASAHVEVVSSEPPRAVGNAATMPGLTTFGQLETNDPSTNGPLSLSALGRASPQSYSSNTQPPKMMTPIPPPMTTQRPPSTNGPSSALILRQSPVTMRNKIKSPSAKEETPTIFGPDIFSKKRLSSEDHAPPAKKQALDSNGPTLQMDGDLLHRREKAKARSDNVNAQHPCVPNYLSTPQSSNNPGIIDLEAEIVFKKMRKRVDRFPRYPTGTIYIEIAVLDDQYTYSLDRTVLESSSTWFKISLNEPPPIEHDFKLARKMREQTKYRGRYELRYVEDIKEWKLYRATFTTPKPAFPVTTTRVQTEVISVPNPTSDFQQIPMSKPSSSARLLNTTLLDVALTDPVKKKESSPEIKAESGTSKSSPKEKSTTPNRIVPETVLATSEAATHRSGVPIELCETFDNLFRTFYHLPPNIDNNNIDRALKQAENLIGHAIVYGSLEIVRPYINNCVLQYGGDIYKAILQDPPRWLLLSIHLEAAPIFKEAIIHIVGKWPYWDWKTVGYDELPLSTRDLIAEKYNWLKIKRLQVNQKLFLNTIKQPHHDEETALDPRDRSFDTWLIIALWRDWFCRSLALRNNPEYRDYYDGIIFRKIASGNDAYLSFSSVWNSLAAFKGRDFAKWSPQDVERGLSWMKGTAQNMVHEIVVNHSMCDVKVDGINYLTCVKVENEELPWVREKLFGGKGRDHGQGKAC